MSKRVDTKPPCVRRTKRGVSTVGTQDEGGLEQGEQVGKVYQEPEGCPHFLLVLWQVFQALEHVFTVAETPHSSTNA